MQSEDTIRKLSEYTSIKEKEWKTALEEQNRHLTTTLTSYMDQLELEKTRFRKLKEDFEYNLNLLNERDRELKNYDKVFEKLRVDFAERNENIEETTSRLVNCERSLEKCTKEKEEMKYFYEQKLNDLLHELHNGMTKKENVIRCKNNEIDELKNESAETLQNEREESKMKYNKLLMSFQDVVKEKEKISEQLISQEALINPLKAKVKLLENEAIVVRESNTNIKENIAQSNEETSALKKQLLKTKIEFNEVKTQAENEQKKLTVQLKNLLSENETLKNEIKTTTEDFQIKSNEIQTKNSKMQLLLQKKEKQLKNISEKFSETCNQEKLKLQQALWEKDYLKKNFELELKSNRETIEQLARDLKDLRERSTQQVVSKDLQVENLLQSERELKHTVDSLKEQLKSCRKELHDVQTTKQYLEIEKTKQDLELRRNYEEREQLLYKEYEQELRNQINAKNEAISSLGKKKEEFEKVESEFNGLKKNYEIIVKYLRKDHVKVSPPVEEQETTSDTVSKSNDLADQNKLLKNVISQMREEIERLSSHNISSDEPTNKRHDYVDVLEKEILGLKQAHRELKQQLENESRDTEFIELKRKLEDVENLSKDLQKEKDDLLKAKGNLETSLHEKDAVINHLNTLLIPEKLPKSDVRNTVRSNEHRRQEFTNADSEVEEKLRKKLNLALKQIKDLSKDRFALTQVNNKLTADRSRLEKKLEDTLKNSVETKDMDCQCVIDVTDFSCQTAFVEKGLLENRESPRTKFSTSGDSEHLSEIWKLLDDEEALSSTVISKQSDVNQRVEKINPKREKRKVKKPVPKIRNYNIKEDI